MTEHRVPDGERPIAEPRAPSGILIVDKPEGPTSHDVVAWARRALGTRTVGHAGTLDPFASGVLVVLVGDGTKLASYATGQDKHYRTEIVLGTQTDTLDRDGTVVEVRPVPALPIEAVRAAAERIRARPTQLPPVIAAIKKDGVPLYARARRGEHVEVEPRTVVLRAITIDAVEGDVVTATLHCGKGYYVRAFGRDLGIELGTVGHLRSLRRLASGQHRVEDALDGEVLRRAARGDQGAQAAVRAALGAITPDRAPLPTAVIDDDVAIELRCGKRPALDRLPPLPDEPVLAFDGRGTPVAIIEARDGLARVVRGMAS